MAYADGGAAWREAVKDEFGEAYDFWDPLSKYNVATEDLTVVDGRSDPDVATTVGVKEIVEEDKRLLAESEGVLVGYSQVHSIGTPMEAIYARERGMPVALWIRDDTAFDELSPWYRYHATAMTTDVELALQHLRRQTANDERDASDVSHPVREALSVVERIPPLRRGAEIDPTQDDLDWVEDLLQEAAGRPTDAEDGVCPVCGTEGDGDDVLANDQLWCPGDCPIVSFHAGGETA
jgi:hypothetical protein